MKSDLHYMKQAFALAEQAAQSGEVPVGAVLVSSDGQVFAEHNAPITTSDACAHAEIRVIKSACAALNNYRLNGSTLYVTLEPCCMCAGAIMHARIDRLVYAATDPKTGAVESLYQLLSDQRFNHQVKISRGVMADESSTLLKQFFKARRSNKKTLLNRGRE